MYPAYQDQVALVLVSVDPSDGPEELRAWQAEHGYPGVVVMGDGEALAALRVVTHSSKVGVDRHGVIAFRGGYGEVPTGSWEGALEALARR